MRYKKNKAPMIALGLSLASAFVLPIEATGLSIVGMAASIIWSAFSKPTLVTDSGEKWIGSNRASSFNDGNLFADVNFHDRQDVIDHSGDMLQVNPANGLPMLADSQIDVEGNQFGFDSNNSPFI